MRAPAVEPLAAITALLLGCGPAVRSDPKESGTSGATESAPDESSGGRPDPREETGTSADASGGAGEASSGTDSNREPVCGNGIVEDFEACDDGNADDGDGCSARCEPPGTIRWTAEQPPGYGVGIAARDGEVAVGIQQITDIPTLLVRVHDREGVQLHEHTDVGGYSDIDFARDPLAFLPNGAVALGYPVVDDDGVVRHVGVLEPGTGVTGAFLASGESWGTYYGTTANSAGIFVMHQAQGALQVEQLDETATRIETLPLEAEVMDHRPIFPGALPNRTLSLLTVLTTNPAGEVELWENLLSVNSWSTYEIGESSVDVRVSAFADLAFIRIWTGTEMITVDQFNHLESTEPLALNGTLLWADALGLVLHTEDGLVLADPTGQAYTTVELPVEGVPHLVRADPEGGGLFVVVDEGPVPELINETVTLAYVVR